MKPLDQIDYTPLMRMDNAWLYAWKEMKPLYKALSVALIILSVVLSFLVRHPLPVFCVPFLAIVVLSTKARSIRERAWVDFATANGWEFIPQPSDLTPWIPPGIDGVGHKPSMSAVVHATFSGHECDLFLYEFSTGSGKSETTHTYTVAMVELSRPFPHLILDSKFSFTLQQRGDALQKIKLEGNFDKHFSLYCRKNEQIDALSVITPDVMQTLIQSNQPQDIEIMDNYLYFMCAQDERGAKTTPVLLAAVDALADQIDQKARTIEYTPEHVAVPGWSQPTIINFFRNNSAITNPVFIVVTVIIFLPTLLIIWALLAT